jgi:hypothetical protein
MREREAQAPDKGYRLFFVMPSTPQHNAVLSPTNPSICVDFFKTVQTFFIFYFSFFLFFGVFLGSDKFVILLIFFNIYFKCGNVIRYIIYVFFFKKKNMLLLFRKMLSDLLIFFLYPPDHM